MEMKDEMNIKNVSTADFMENICHKLEENVDILHLQ